MGKYNNNGISRYGNSRDGTPFHLCQEVLNKLSYNGILNSSVWRDVRGRDGGRSRSRDMIVGLHDGNRIWRVSPDMSPDSMNIIPKLPGVVFNSVSFPFDQVPRVMIR